MRAGRRHWVPGAREVPLLGADNWGLLLPEADDGACPSQGLMMGGLPLPGADNAGHLSKGLMVVGYPRRLGHDWYLTFTEHLSTITRGLHCGPQSMCGCWTWALHEAPVIVNARLFSQKAMEVIPTHPVADVSYTSSSGTSAPG